MEDLDLDLNIFDLEELGDQIDSEDSICDTPLVRLCEGEYLELENITFSAEKELILIPPDDEESLTYRNIPVYFKQEYLGNMEVSLDSILNLKHLGVSITFVDQDSRCDINQDNILNFVTL